MTVKFISGYSDFNKAIACNEKSKPFKGTSALAVVITPLTLGTIFGSEQKVLKSIPLGMT